MTISGTSPGRILEEQTLAFDWSENGCPAMQEWFYLYVCTPAGLMLHLRVLFRAQEQTRNSLLWLSQKNPQVGIQDHSTLDHALASSGGREGGRRGEIHFEAQATQRSRNTYRMNCPRGSIARIKTACQQTSSLRNR